MCLCDNGSIQKEVQYMTQRTPQGEDSLDEWGNGRVVYTWGDEGKWIMYDPDSDTIDISNWQ